MPTKIHPTIIVGGMHRSGTSLTASLLAALSVQLGDQLLPGDSHNQPGYFEDIAFLDFQRQVLAQCVPDEPGHADWGWTESERLDVGKFNEFYDQAQHLINVRSRASGPWGWKDPRTTLFLDFWDNLLEEPRFVFVYRFPWDVADSMQRLGAEVFLKNPEYAYRIWAFYNRRIRDFYLQHSERCLLVSVNALKENLESFVDLLAGKLGVPTGESQLEDVFRDHLFRTVAGQDPLIDLVAEAWPDCVQLLSELDQLADISSDGLWQARPVRSRLSRPDATDNEPVTVSIVTPCYEQGTLLLEAIASTERHAPPHCELIIVNDGSQQPRTLAILELLKRSGYFVIDQENAGLSASRNKAIGLARGRYILPLDDDNRLREGFIAEAIAVLDSSPEVGIVYGDRYDFGLRTGIQYDLGLRTGNQEIPEFDLDRLLDGNYIDACAVFRKQVWAECQGYDPLMCPVDDWEFWIHAAERGWRFHHIPRVVFDYRVRPGSLISKIDSPEKDAEFRRRLRVKHSELYWAKSIKEREVAKWQTKVLKNELDSLAQELEAAKREWTKQFDSLAIQLADRDAHIERMTNSRGWRLVSYYGRLKHRFLSPVFQLFNRIAVKRTETTRLVGSALNETNESAGERSTSSVDNRVEDTGLDPGVKTHHKQDRPNPPTVNESLGQGRPIFYHRPHGGPVHGITDEVIQGFTELSELIIENPRRLVFSKPDNLTLVTYNNYNRRVLIEKNYEAYGINEYVVLGKEIAQWDWSAKVRPVLDYLGSGRCLSEYIVATDSDDVLMVNDPSRIVDLFESYSCDVLFCNTFVDYPANKCYREFESLKYYTHPFHSHLSAGGYVARRDALIEFLKEITAFYDERSHWAMDGEVFNDQLAWRHLHHKYYPRIKVDFKSLIFKRYDLFLSLD